MSRNKTEAKGYTDLLNESVHTNDDIDIGDIEAVSMHFVVVKRGIINVHRYYIPIQKVEGWDGNVLWLKIDESEVINNFERNVEPDPYRYHLKDYQFYVPPYYPNMMWLKPRSVPARTDFLNPPTSELRSIIQCDLCGKRLNTDNELGSHISGEHN